MLYLGFVPNKDKCDFVPTQDFDFVGTHYLLHHSKVTPTEKRITSIQTKSLMFLNKQTRTGVSVYVIDWFFKFHFFTGGTYGSFAYSPNSVATGSILV